MAQMPESITVDVRTFPQIRDLLADVWDEAYADGYDDGLYITRGLSTDPDAGDYPHDNPYRRRGKNGNG